MFEEENLTMADLMPEVDKSMIKIRRGQIKKATVISVEDSEIIANIGYQADAILPWKEYGVDTVDKSEVKIGDEFNVKILRVDDGDGNVLVSKRGADSEVSNEEITKMFKDKEVISVKIKDVTKGGLITSVKGARAFIPGSQVTDTYVEDLSHYVGKTIDVNIIEFEPNQRKLILSGKQLARARRSKEREARLSQLNEGDKCQGVVTKLMPYGAFVSLDGVEGLVHNSDLSWTRIKHPSDVVKEGDKVEVTILAVNKEDGKVSLAIKDINGDPWQVNASNIEEGQVLSGTVIKFMPFGAFVRLESGLEGLVHISQICSKRINKPEDVLTLEQNVDVKVTKIDKEGKKISLSILEAEGNIE